MIARFLVENGHSSRTVSRTLLEDIKDDIEQAIEDTDTAPTDEEKENDDYDKGEFEWNGLVIALENPKGSTRSGVDENGDEWSVTMPAHYGEFVDTKSRDKDPVDVYVGDEPDSDKVFVVNQHKKAGGFDEHKVFVGYTDEQSVINCYDAAFSNDLGPKLRDSVVEITVDELIDWLENGDTKKEYPTESE